VHDLGGVRRENLPVPKVLSYGGGLDSYVMLLRAIERGEKPDVVVFMDVGDGSPDADGRDPAEWPGTYRHIREHVIPLCEEHGIEFYWMTTADWPVREARSLFAWMEVRGQIPVSGPKRICTTMAKVERFERWMDSRWPGREVEVWVGFEAGEEKRAANDPNAGKKRKLKPEQARRRNRFPLIEEGLCRCQCEAYVRARGLPVPRKSACVFCPYATKADFRTLSQELPEQWERVVALEANKPMTKATEKKMSKKLSIKGFRTLKDKKTGKEIGYRHTPLPVYIQKPEKSAPQKLCGVCGAQVRATKATGCSFLSDERAA
jgi:hypothetical protein